MSFTKASLFLKPQNVAKIVKELKSLTCIPLDEVQDRVMTYIKNWDKLYKYDMYESLTGDIYMEVEGMNRDFIRDHRTRFETRPGNDFKSLETPDDYTNYDIRRVDTSVQIDNSQFRYGNRVPYYQKIVARQHDMHAELRGRSLGQETPAMRGMDRVLEVSSRPYRKVDDLDVQYYGRPQNSQNAGVGV